MFVNFARCLFVHSFVRWFVCLFLLLKKKSMLVNTVILSVPIKHSVDPDLMEINTNIKRTKLAVFTVPNAVLM